MECLSFADRLALDLWVEQDCLNWRTRILKKRLAQANRDDGRIVEAPQCPMCFSRMDHIPKLGPVCGCKTESELEYHDRDSRYEIGHMSKGRLCVVETTAREMRSAATYTP